MLLCTHNLCYNEFCCCYMQNLITVAVWRPAFFLLLQYIKKNNWKLFFSCALQNNNRTHTGSKPNICRKYYILKCRIEVYNGNLKRFSPFFRSVSDYYILMYFACFKWSWVWEQKNDKQVPQPKEFIIPISECFKFILVVEVKCIG